MNEFLKNKSGLTDAVWPQKLSIFELDFGKFIIMSVIHYGQKAYELAKKLNSKSAY